MDRFKVALRMGDRAGYAKGGLAAAEKTRTAGRMGDTKLVHVNPREYEEMCARWGKPSINPETGLPEFFLGSIRDWFKDNEWAQYAAPAAVSLLAPGIGGAIGGAASDALGLGLSEGVTSALGNALVGGGIGALTSGGEGALKGALVGGITPSIANALGLGGGLSSILGLGGAGAASGALPTVAQGGVGPDIPAAAQGASGAAGAASGGGLLGGGGSSVTSLAGKALPLVMAAGALSSMLGSKDAKKGAQTTSAMTPEQKAAEADMRKPLSNVPFNRTRTPMPSKKHLKRYGYGPEHEFFANNQLPAVPAAEGGMIGYARGGKVAPRPKMGALGKLPMPGVNQAMRMPATKPGRYVDGPGSGRDDLIPAALSRGEYVIDAETTALLGDGSPEHGAKKLDEMRSNIRKHKGGALSKGKISPNAKRPEQYMGRGR